MSHWPQGRCCRTPATVYDPHATVQQRDEDLDIAQVGRSAKMPWESDGRRWHTRDRVGRKGEPCRWDGRILETVVDRIQQLGEFDETDWSTRSVVEITAAKRGQPWFFHAITGETWLLKLKFRTSRDAVDGAQLAAQLDLKTLNQMDEIPQYSNEPRVRVKLLPGAWQEIELRVHTLDEIDRPAFWSSWNRPCEDFHQTSATTSIEDAMPWKKLGRKWHLLRKGFPPGKRVLAAGTARTGLRTAGARGSRRPFPMAEPAGRPLPHPGSATSRGPACIPSARKPWT
jgi:excinuclease ABC subunit A